MASEPKNYYRARINKAVRYIEEHLSEEISIQQLAEAAHFSTFHFQRLYKALQSETPYDTIQRLRLQKAVFLFRHYPKRSVADIAFECGFASLENFSRQFKKRFGHSPTAFRRNKEVQKSRMYQDDHRYDIYTIVAESNELPAPEFTVTVERLSTMPTGFIRASFGEDGMALVKACQNLIDWGRSRGIPVDGPGRLFGMSVDDHRVTPTGLYRYDFALVIEGAPDSDGIVEFGEIPGVEYATLHCDGDIQLVSQAWTYLYEGWLPESGYAPLHYPAMEEYLETPEDIGWERFNINCRIPVGPIDDHE